MSQEHLAGVALEPRDDAKMIEIDDERRARGCHVARKGDEADRHWRSSRGPC